MQEIKKHSEKKKEILKIKTSLISNIKKQRKNLFGNKLFKQIFF